MTLETIIIIISVMIIWVVIYSLNDHEVCYTDMEKQGRAAMGLCCGTSGGTRNTNYLSELCIDCPHYTSVMNNVRKDDLK